MQLEAAPAPGSAEAVPTAQSVHVVEPAAAHVPAGHVEQLRAPSAAAVPAGQRLHCVSVAAVHAAIGALPAAHVEHVVQAETPPGEKLEPATQAAQAEVLPAGLAKPGPQTAHTRLALAEQAVVCAEPAAQIEQGTHALEPSMGA